jgi:hypothetical protein
MARPAPAITGTSKGRLQLRFVSERIAFRCARCQQDKMVNWVGLDGTHTICILCYSAMVGSSEQERPNAAEKMKQPPVQAQQRPVPAQQQPVQAKQRSVQAKQQPSRKVRPERTKEKPLQPIGGKLRRQFPGLESLIAFLRTADVSVELVRGRYLRLDGTQTEPLRHLPPQETLEWNSVVNEIAWSTSAASSSGL